MVLRSSCFVDRSFRDADVRDNGANEKREYSDSSRIIRDKNENEKCEPNANHNERIWRPNSSRFDHWILGIVNWSSTWNTVTANCAVNQVSSFARLGQQVVFLARVSKKIFDRASCVHSSLSLELRFSCLVSSPLWLASWNGAREKEK